MEPNAAGTRNEIIWDPDALDAYRTFRHARSVLFWVLLIGLLLIQACFWVVDLGVLDRPLRVETSHWRLIGLSDAATWTPVQEGAQRMAETWKDAVQVTLQFCWYALTFVAVLYSLTLLIGMKLALVGRLGALGPHGKAFFLSLVVAALVVPWTAAIHPQLFGALFTWHELVSWYLEVKQGAAAKSIYYMRFVGIWAFAVVLLLWAQGRSWQAARRIRPALADEEDEPQEDPYISPSREDQF